MTSKSLTTWTDFQAALDERAADFGAILPPHVPRDRFRAIAVAAVKQTPGLLQVAPRSLFAALTAAAEDGLLPNARQGVILPYKGIATWIPMTAGLRKRAYELDQVRVAAAIVYENDHFIWHQGDDERLEHQPAPFLTPRGDAVGVYSIFRQGAERAIVHREVMDKDAIERVRQTSRQPNGTMWKTFWEEAWKKTVIRRGFKAVPVSEPLDKILRRDDAMYDFDGEAKPVATATALPRRRGPVHVVKGPATAPPPSVAAFDDTPDDEAVAAPPPEEEWDQPEPPPVDDSTPAMPAGEWTISPIGRATWSGDGDGFDDMGKRLLFNALSAEINNARTGAEARSALHANKTLVERLPDASVNVLKHLVEGKGR